MSTSGASLVHPSTSKLGPEHQAKGVYQYTPPEVLAYQRGEPLSADDQKLVIEYYFDNALPRPVFNVGLQEPALAEVPDNVAGMLYGRDGPAEHTTKRVVRKAPDEPPSRVLDAVVILVDGLSDAHAEVIFNRLAKNLGYDIQ